MKKLKVTKDEIKGLGEELIPHNRIEKIEMGIAIGMFIIILGMLIGLIMLAV